MKKSNFALRLQPALLKETRKLADAEGVAVNQLINVAVAEKLSALRTQEYFAERSAKADITKALGSLKRAGVGQLPVPGDEMPVQNRRNRSAESSLQHHPSNSIDEQVRFAIAHKRLMKISYGGYQRIVEPHDYGLKNGARKLLAYQVRGGSASQSKGSGWKMLDISKIDKYAVLKSSFHGSREDSAQRHITWDELFARVA